MRKIKEGCFCVITRGSNAYRSVKAVKKIPPGGSFGGVKNENTKHSGWLVVGEDLLARVVTASGLEIHRRSNRALAHESGLMRIDGFDPEVEGYYTFKKSK